MTRRYHIQFLLIILGLTRTRDSVSSTSIVHNKHNRRRYIRQLVEPKEEIQDGKYKTRVNDEQRRHSTLGDIEPIITTLGRRDLNYIEASDSSRDYISHFQSSEIKGITINADIPQSIPRNPVSNSKDSTDYVDKKTSNTSPTQNIRTRSKKPNSSNIKSSKTSSKSSKGKGKGKSKGSKSSQITVSPTPSSDTYEPTVTPTTTTQKPVKQQPTPNPVPTKTPTNDFPTKLPTKPITAPPVIPSPTKVPSKAPPGLPTPEPATPIPVKPITTPPTTTPTCIGPGC